MEIPGSNPPCFVYSQVVSLLPISILASLFICNIYLFIYLFSALDYHGSTKYSDT